jgi:hypothetical protein
MDSAGKSSIWHSALALLLSGQYEGGIIKPTVLATPSFQPKHQFPYLLRPSAKPSCTIPSADKQAAENPNIAEAQRSANLLHESRSLKVELWIQHCRAASELAR